MAGRFGPTALISAGLILLNLCAFVVLLGGASALQSDASTISSLLNTVNQQPGTLLAYGELFPLTTAGNFISYQWFKAVTQVVVLLFALAVIALGQVFRFRVALVGLFAVLTVYFSDSANTFYYLFLQVKDNAQVTKRIRREVESYFAGCIMTATLNFLIIISLGHGVETTAGTGNTGNYNAGPATGVKETGNGAASV